MSKAVAASLPLLLALLCLAGVAAADPTLTTALTTPALSTPALTVSTPVATATVPSLTAPQATVDPSAVTSTDPTAAVATVTVPPATTPTVSTPVATVPPATTPAVQATVAPSPTVTVGAVTTPTVTTPVGTLPSVTTPQLATTGGSKPPQLTVGGGSSNVTTRTPSPAGGSSRPSGPTATPSAPTGTPGSQNGSQSGSQNGSQGHPSVNRPVSGAGPAPGRLPNGQTPVTPAPGVAAPSHQGDPAGPGQSGLSAAVGDVVHVIKIIPGWIWALIAGLALLLLLVSVRSYVEGVRRRRLGVEVERQGEEIEVLQHALTPPLELSGALAASAAYQSADGLVAGGDFYDVFPLEDGGLAFLLGDVSGHGRAAVSRATLARYTIRALLADGRTPSQALAGADRALAAELDIDSFVTAVAGVYDPDQGRLVYAKAGHHAPLLAGLDYDAELDPAGPPLGTRLADEWPETAIALPAGTRVCLFTDGVIEARTATGMLGRSRLQELLAEHHDGAALLAAVRAEVVSADDDMAVCLLERPQPQSAPVMTGREQASALPSAGELAVTSP